MKKLLLLSAFSMVGFGQAAFASDADVILTFQHQNFEVTAETDMDEVTSYRLRGRIDALLPAEVGGLEPRADVMVTRNEVLDETAFGIEPGLTKVFERGSVYGLIRVEYVDSATDYTRVTPIVGATYAINTDLVAFGEVAMQQNVDNGSRLGSWADLGLEYGLSENFAVAVSARHLFDVPGSSDDTRARVELISRF